MSSSLRPCTSPSKDRALALQYSSPDSCICLIGLPLIDVIFQNFYYKKAVGIIICIKINYPLDANKFFSKILSKYICFRTRFVVFVDFLSKFTYLFPNLPRYSQK